MLRWLEQPRFPRLDPCPVTQSAWTGVAEEALCLETSGSILLRCEGSLMSSSGAGHVRMPRPGRRASDKDAGCWMSAPLSDDVPDQSPKTYREGQLKELPIDEHHRRIIRSSKTPSQIPRNEVLAFPIQLIGIRRRDIRSPDGTRDRGLGSRVRSVSHHQDPHCVMGKGLEVGNFRLKVAEQAK